jgi:general secretion pathway protein G
MARESEGFTLIELLIVIVVLGILAAVVVFALGSVTGSARVSACDADAKTIVSAVQAYDAGTAPTDITVETAGVAPGDIHPGNPATYAAPGTQAALLVSNGYINAWPTSTNDYAMSLSTTQAGDVSVYFPATSAVPMSYDHQTAASGCNAL